MIKFSSYGEEDSDAELFPANIPFEDDRCFTRIKFLQTQDSEGANLCGSVI